MSSSTLLKRGLICVLGVPLGVTLVAYFSTNSADGTGRMLDTAKLRADAAKDNPVNNNVRAQNEALMKHVRKAAGRE